MANLYVDGHIITIDDEDYDRCKIYKWYLNRPRSRVVVQANINNKSTSIGRFLLGYVGPDEVDHKDRNPYNNRKSNLRIATRSQQMANSKPQLKRKFKGVHLTWNKNLLRKYRATIKVNGKAIHLGYFAVPETAARVYDYNAKKIFGEFANLNFPEIKT